MAGNVTWTPEAQAELDSTPWLIRGRMKKKIEEFARERGQNQVTLDFLKEAKAAREKDKGQQ